MKSLPDMIKTAHDGQLKQGLQSHLKETDGHVKRLEQVFQMMGKKAKSQLSMRSAGANRTSRSAPPTNGCPHTSASSKLLKWLWDRGITPHVPVWDKSARSDGKFSRADFVFDRERNVYICPAGAELTHSGIIDQGRILPYRASTKDCSICKLKPRCTTAIARKVSRDIDEDVRDHVRALANTPKPSSCHAASARR